MKPQHRRAVDTRRLYRFEDTTHFGRWLEQPRRMPCLRRWALRLWALYGRAHALRVAAGRGTPYGGKLFSYCMGTSYIQLARHERTLKVLAHELVHALGYPYHNRAFVLKMQEVLTVLLNAKAK